MEVSTQRLGVGSPRGQDCSVCSNPGCVSHCILHFVWHFCVICICNHEIFIFFILTPSLNENWKKLEN